MDEDVIVSRMPLPCDGIWSIEDLASWLEIAPSVVQNKLNAMHIPIVGFSNRYKHKVFSLSILNEKVILG